jgi:hypothetical protein
MWSPHDRRLAERDQALPALRVLLDSDALAGWLEARVPNLRGHAHCTYVRYKPGVRVLSGWAIRTPEGRSTPASRLERPPRRPAQAREAGRAGREPRGTRGRGVLRPRGPDPRRVLSRRSTFGNLARMADPEIRSDLLRGSWGRGADTGPRRSRLELPVLSYKPERRFVGVAELGTGMGRPARSRRRHEATRGALPPAPPGRPRVPFRGRVPGARAGRREPTASPPVHGVDARQPASSLSSRWPRPRREGASGVEIGAGLAELHAQHAERLRRRGGLRRPGDCGRRPGASRRDARPMGPSGPPARAKRLEGPSRGLRSTSGTSDGAPARRLPSRAGAPGGEGGLVLLDFDRARMGDPEADLASFVSHLERRELEGHLAEGRRRGVPGRPPRRLSLGRRALLGEPVPDPPFRRAPATRSPPLPGQKPGLARPHPGLLQRP